MDAQNTLRQHLIVGVFSLALAYIFNSFLGIDWAVSFARVSFILLFLVLIIGPIMRIKEPGKSSTPFMTPWKWRGELGIWFALTGLIHFIIVLSGSSIGELIKIGGSGYALANLLGLVALFLALILAVTSFGKVIGFLGVESWKHLHTLTYVIFYLVAGHFMYFQFFSTYGEVGPDWFGYMAVAMTLIVIILQAIAFILAVAKREKKMNPIK